MPGLIESTKHTQALLVDKSHVPLLVLSFDFSFLLHM